MMTAEKLKKVVNNWNDIVSIPDRASVTHITLFVRELLKESGDEDAAALVMKLADELENLDTDDIVKAQIWNR